MAKQDLLTGTLALVGLLAIGCRGTNSLRNSRVELEKKTVSEFATDTKTNQVGTTQNQPTVSLASASSALQSEGTTGEPSDKAVVDTALPINGNALSKVVAEHRPNYSAVEELPIDLPTVVRLIDSESPAILVSRAKIAESLARYEHSKLQWLPSLSAGIAYNRFDGQTQNQRGDVFSVSRSNMFVGGGPMLSIDTAEAYYRPLIERRLLLAEQWRSRAIVDRTELEGVIAYYDLVQLHAQKAINSETLQRSEDMLKAAINAKESKLDRTAGDLNRAKMEVLARRVEGKEIDAKILAASARLASIVSIQPCVRLMPNEPAIVPIELIEPTCTLDDLIQTAIRQRADLESNRQLLAAAWERVRRQQDGVLLPKIVVSDQGGTYGGGTNSTISDFDGRNVLGAQIYWEIKNLGFGNQSELNERRQMATQARWQLAEAQAKAVAEVVEVAQTTSAKYETIEIAAQGVEEAEELYRISKEGIQNVVDAKNLFDALRPLQSIQLTNQLKINYLAAIIDFNKSQFRLFTLLGRPSRVALERTDFQLGQ